MSMCGFYSVLGTYFHSSVYKKAAVFLFPNLYYVSRNRSPSFFSHKGSGRAKNRQGYPWKDIHAQRLSTHHLCIDNEKTNKQTKTSDSDDAHNFPFFFFVSKITCIINVPMGHNSLSLLHPMKMCDTGSSPCALPHSRPAILVSCSSFWKACQMCQPPSCWRGGETFPWPSQVVWLGPRNWTDSVS